MLYRPPRRNGPERRPAPSWLLPAAIVCACLYVFFQGVMFGFDYQRLMVSLGWW